jgi:hypothetical protein
MTKTIIGLAVLLTLSTLSASAFLTHASEAHASDGMSFTDNSEIRFAEDGAFRDGLYLGKLAAQSRRVQSPAIGRWSSDEDRASFAAGYRLGYKQNKILTSANQTAGESSE